MDGILPLISRLTVPKFNFKPKAKVVVDTAKLDLLAHIKETQIRLTALRSAFENEVNFDLIDIYILEIDALERQFSYLLKQAKIQCISAF